MTPTKTIIFLCGRRMAGKNSLGDAMKAYLMELFGAQSCEEISIAAPLKDLVARMLARRTNRPYEELRPLMETHEGKATALWDPTTTNRELLVSVGFSARQALQDNFWSAQAARRAQQSRAQFIIVPDCRFADEMDEFYSCGRRIHIAVNRPSLGALNRENADDVAAEQTNASQTLIEKFVAMNDGTLDDWVSRGRLLAASIVASL